MLPALLATFLFCLSAVTATRATKLIGSISANFWRLILATLLLACWAHGVKSGLKGHGFPMLFWSGVIGFGLGDLALYMALPRLGSRLTLLIVHCVAAPFAAAVEWIWLKTLLSPAQIACIGLILVGVAMALMPSQRDASWQVQGGIVGIIYGVFGALGQGMGAVMSRVAYDINDRHGFEIDGLSAAYQRILGGLLVATLAMVFSVWKKRSLRAPKHIGEDSEAVPSTRGMSAWPFVIGTALAGPALGVGCYQWALKMTPSGVVLPIVATTPLMVMPLSAWMEGDRPPARSVYGGVLAVIGVILLGRLASS
jgi:drug/metabolite transporter (DMT)-like permease